MTAQLIDQRGNTEQTTITRHDVDEAWRLVVIAADRHEDIGTMATKEDMLEAVEYAERLQALYDEQYEQWVTS